VHAGAFFSGQNVRIEGTSKVYTRISHTGFAVHFRFCPTCGTSVYWIRDRQPDKLGVAVGCFADPTFPVPTHSVWEEQASLARLAVRHGSSEMGLRPGWNADNTMTRRQRREPPHQIGATGSMA
jgi:hypothetical protein